MDLFLDAYEMDPSLIVRKFSSYYMLLKFDYPLERRYLSYHIEGNLSKLRVGSFQEDRRTKLGVLVFHFLVHEAQRKYIPISAQSSVARDYEHLRRAIAWQSAQISLANGLSK